MFFKPFPLPIPPIFPKREVTITDFGTTEHLLKSAFALRLTLRMVFSWKMCIFGKCPIKIKTREVSHV